MKNLYAQFSMKPPSKELLGNKLVAARTPNMPPVQVRKSLAPKDFYNRVEVPASKAFVQTPYPLGARGGLSGFGAFSGNPALTLVEGVEFRFDIDKKDFITGRPIHQEGVRKLGLSWTPVQPTFVKTVDDKLKALRAGGPSAQMLADQLITDGSALAKKVGDVGEGVEFEAVLLGARGEVDIFGKVIRNEVEKNRLNAMRDLKSWMGYVASVAVPQEAGYTPPAGGGTTTTGGSGGGFQPGKGGGYTPSTPAGGYTPGPQPQPQVGAGLLKPAAGPNYMLYGLGAAALVVGLLVARKAMR